MDNKDILSEIFRYLDTYELYRAGGVCQIWRASVKIRLIHVAQLVKVIRPNDIDSKLYLWTVKHKQPIEHELYADITWPDTGYATEFECLNLFHCEII